MQIVYSKKEAKYRKRQQHVWLSAIPGLDSGRADVDPLMGTSWESPSNVFYEA